MNSNKDWFEILLSGFVVAVLTATAFFFIMAVLSGCSDSGRYTKFLTRETCVEGVVYLTHASSITVKLDRNGEIEQCDPEPPTITDEEEDLEVAAKKLTPKNIPVFCYKNAAKTDNCKVTVTGSGEKYDVPCWGKECRRWVK